MENKAEVFSSEWTIDAARKVAHAANQAYKKVLGESCCMVSKIPDEIIIAHLSGKVHGRLESHYMWMEDMEKKGWTYGKVRDEKLKTHPNMLPYAEMNELQKKKDEIFIAAMNVFAQHWSGR